MRTDHCMAMRCAGKPARGATEAGSACTAAGAGNTSIVQPVSSASLPDLGPAPELTNESWLNVDSPLRLANLRGKVVAIDMWTFGYINCQHVIPSLKEWDEKYVFLLFNREKKHALDAK